MTLALIKEACIQPKKLVLGKKMLELDGDS